MDHSIEYGRQNEEQNNRDAKQVGHNITIIYWNIAHINIIQYYELERRGKERNEVSISMLHREPLRAFLGECQ